MRVTVTVPWCVQTWCGQIPKMNTSLQCYSLVLYSVCVCVCVRVCSCNCTKVCADMVWSDSEDEDFTAVLLLGVVQCVCVW